MKLPFRFILVSIVAAAGVTASRGFAAGPDRRQMLERQKAHYEKTLESLEPLNVHRMSDVLRLRVENGALTMQTSLDPGPTFQGRRALIDGLRGPAIVTYTQFIPNDPNARQFEFTLEDYPDADTYGRLHLQWRPAGPNRPAEMSFERTEQTSHSFMRVFYMQGRVTRLIVFDNDTADDRAMRSFSDVEKDFATLRQRHAGDIERWVRPIFRKLRQDAIFAPDENVAWQALADEWPVNAAAHAAVLKLLPQLNDDSSRVRNRASDALARLGLDGATAILRLGRTGLTLEQNVRLDEVISRFRRLSPGESAQLRNDPDFLLDCQYCDDPTIRKLSAARLSELLGYPVPLNSDAPEEGRMAAVERVRNQIHPASTTQPAH